MYLSLYSECQKKESLPYLLSIDEKVAEAERVNLCTFLFLLH